LFSFEPNSNVSCQSARKSSKRSRQTIVTDDGIKIHCKNNGQKVSYFQSDSILSGMKLKC
jgi:hypothetical protein